MEKQSQIINTILYKERFTMVINTITMNKQEIMKELLVIEHLIDTYSRIDLELVDKYTSKKKELESNLLLILTEENNTWLLDQKQNA